MRCSDCQSILKKNNNLSDSYNNDNWSYCEVKECKNAFHDSYDKPHSYTDELGQIVCQVHKE